MTRSRLRPYLSSTTRVSKASPRSMWKSLMYPSSLRTRAISAFIRDEGMVAVSWSARFAFRIRVSMSETGSVSIVPPLPARLGHAGDEALVREQVELVGEERDRKSTRLNSSHSQISYAVFCLKKKNTNMRACV